MLKKKDSGVISSRSNSLLHEKLCTHSKRGVSPSSQMPYIRRPTAYDHLHSNTQSVSPDLGCETAPNNWLLPASKNSMISNWLFFMRKCIPRYLGLVTNEILGMANVMQTF